MSFDTLENAKTFSFGFATVAVVAASSAMRGLHKYIISIGDNKQPWAARATTRKLRCIENNYQTLYG